MPAGLIGRKCGMTRILNAEGVAIPVTVVQIEQNQVVQLKTVETCDYNAIQVKVGEKAANKVNKPVRGHYAKANVEPGRMLHEFRLTNEEASAYKVGDMLDVANFKEGQKVNVQGISKGKGFAGCVKRHNFRTQDATHGNSLSHRVPGSTGQNQSPGKVFKGKKMAGQLGNVNKTIRNLEVVKVDSERQLLLLKGSVPGYNGRDIIISPVL
jgi:large subunit ribosomal protein L3